MWVVGLTGGIGSGKSTVAERFTAHGVPVIDTDVIAHDLTAPARGTPPDTRPVGGLGAVPDGAALAAIRAAFGEAVMQADGTLDRAALRRRVFSDSVARHKLEAILHPLIRQQVEQALATLAVTAPYALIVIPLLVETGAYRDVLNRVLVVDCPEDMQIARVMARSGLTRDEVAAILAAQASRSERLAAADDVIRNAALPAAIDAEVASLHRRYLALAAPAP